MALTTLGVSQIDQVREFFGKASGTPANFVIDTTKVQQYQYDTQEAIKILTQYPQFDGLTEIQITEWGHESDNHLGYDSRFAAAHTVAGAMAWSKASIPKAC